MKLYETITAENWCKVYYWSRHGGAGSSANFDRACIAGHSLAISTTPSEHRERMDRVAEAIRVLFPERCSALFPTGGPANHTDFNDHPDTVFADVRRVLKLADV